MYIVGTRPFFDDRELLQLMLALDEHGRLVHMTGEQLLEEASGTTGDEAQRNEFVRELHIAQEDELIGFELRPSLARPEPRIHEYEYLQNLHKFRLRTKGRDRARGEIVREPLPEPGSDDGRPFPTRILDRVARALAGELHGDEARAFLMDAGVPSERLPQLDSTDADYLQTAMISLLERGSSGRRLVRDLIGRWLADQLEIGPTTEQRAEITHALARVGWHVRDGTLVVGERVTGPPRVASVPAALDLVLAICRHFDVVSRQLARRHEKRETLIVTDEYDVQDLLHALLRVHFDDVRAEVWNPSYLGGASRSDLLLPEAGIVIEVKTARDPMPDRRVGDELAEDVTRYRDRFANRGASILVCFIHDRDRVLANPQGLERDLADASTERLRVVGIVG